MVNNALTWHPYCSINLTNAYHLSLTKGGTSMKRLLILFAAMVIAAFGTFTNARAAILDAPVPDNAYISLNGLDWAWAAPCSDVNCGSGFGLDLSFQGLLGWYIPSAAELALAPLVQDFIF